MATQKQMMAAAIPFTTMAGVDYKLPRPTLRVRTAALTFVKTAGALQKIKNADVDVVQKLIESLIDLLEDWLKNNYTDITREQIADTWDIADIPALMEIIKSVEQEVQSSLPPASGPRARTRGRKK